jgi:hypothetical protein
MPKIPTFTAQGVPTAESASIKTSFQIPVSGTGSAVAAFEPVIKSLNDYYVKEQAVVDKTKALELENKAAIEIEELKSRMEKYSDPITSTDIFLQQSKIIRDKYSGEASSSSVKNLFVNNYLTEEKKYLSTILSKNRENLIQDRVNQDELKEKRIITNGLYSDNQLQKETLYTDLGVLYQSQRNDLIIDDDTYLKKVRNIPSTVQKLEFKRDLTSNAVEAAQRIKDINNYPDILGEDRLRLEAEAISDAKPVIKDNTINYLAALETDNPIQIDKKAVKDIMGNQYYSDFVEKETGIIKTKDFKKQIYNSKLGDENKIIESFEIRPESAAFDLKLKQDLINTASQKSRLAKEDPASLVIGYNPVVKNNFNDYQQEQDPTIKDRKFKKYVASVVDAQESIGIYSDNIKVLPKANAVAIVQDYNSRKPQEKIAYLQSLENQYGDNYGRLLTQLSGNELPITAKLVSYFNDENFAIQATSIDNKEERKRLDQFLKDSDKISKDELRKDVATQLSDFQKIIVKSNPFDTEKALKEISDIQEVITYIAANKIFAGKDPSKAVSEATGYITGNFDLKDTYFIPKIYNNKPLVDSQRQHIERKANIIKEQYIDQLDIEPFKSGNEKITDDELNKAIKVQIQKNGMWVNTADGNGIVLAVTLSDGSIGLIENKKGELIKMNFDDSSFKLPTTNIDMSKNILATKQKKEVESLTGVSSTRIRK